MEQPSNLDLLIALTRMETKIENLHLSSADYESRLRVLEKKQWPLPAVGAVTGLGGLGTALLSLLQ